MNPLVTVGAAGVYDMDEESYHADPCPEPSLSSSIAKKILAFSPLHAWAAHPRLNPNREDEFADKFDLGSAAHSLVLHDPKKFEVIEAPDYKTKAARDLRDAARAAGKIPLIEKNWLRVHAMAHAARLQLDNHEEASDAFKNGKPEQTIIWKEGDIWCRARLDWLPDAGNIFDDYKSTAASADPDTYARMMFNLGYDMQAAFYCRGIRALKLARDPTFRFIVQEIELPHALSVISLMPAAVELAQHKVERAISLWRSCLLSGTWPGYPNRTCYVDAPIWHEQQYLERDARVNETIENLNTPENRRIAAEMQAPL